MPHKGPDPRKGRLMRLAWRLVLALLLDLLAQGLFVISFDIFGSTSLQLHEWVSFLHSLNKVLAWEHIHWKGPSGFLFSSASVLASVFMYVFRLAFSSSLSLLPLSKANAHL